MVLNDVFPLFFYRTHIDKKSRHGSRYPTVHFLFCPYHSHFSLPKTLPSAALAPAVWGFIRNKGKKAQIFAGNFSLSLSLAPKKRSPSAIVRNAVARTFATKQNHPSTTIAHCVPWWRTTSTREGKFRKPKWRRFDPTINRPNGSLRSPSAKGKL